MSFRLVYRGRATGLRIALTAFAAAVGCVASSALILMILPTPHTRPHYLLAGTAPTIAGLIAVLARAQRDRARPRSWAVRRAPSNPPAA